MLSEDKYDYIIFQCVVIRLLIILCSRRTNICEDRRARPNRAIVSIEVEKVLAYRDKFEEVLYTKVLLKIRKLSRRNILKAYFIVFSSFILIEY